MVNPALHPACTEEDSVVKVLVKSLRLTTHAFPPPSKRGQGCNQFLYSHSEVSEAVRRRCLGSTAGHMGPLVSHGCCHVVGKDWLALRKGTAGQRSGSRFVYSSPSPCSTVKGGAGFSSLTCCLFHPDFFPFSACALWLSETPLSPFSIFLISTFHCYSPRLLLQASLTQWASSETTNDRMQ